MGLEQEILRMTLKYSITLVKYLETSDEIHSKMKMRHKTHFVYLWLEMIYEIEMYF